MKVYLDNIIYSLQQAGGISNYWHELSTYFIEQLVVPDHNLFFIEREDAKNNIFRKAISIQPPQLLKDQRLPLALSRYLPVGRPVCQGAIFHSSYYRTPLATQCKQVVTVHDFTYEFFRTGFKKTIHSVQKRRALESATGIICISENTKKDMLRLYPRLSEKSIEVIYNGASDKYHYLGLPVTDPMFALYIGERSGYKNFRFAVDFIRELGDTQLYIIGGGALSNTEQALVESKLPGKYRKFAGISNEELNTLFNSARFLIYPSEYEGFGIPVMEAMKSGCPVITGNNSSIPEIISIPDLMMERTDIDNALQISSFIDKNRAAVIRAGLDKSAAFTWSACASSVLNFYKKLDEQ